MRMKAREKRSEELRNFAYLQSESLAKLAPLMASKHAEQSDGLGRPH